MTRPTMGDLGTMTPGQRMDAFDAHAGLMTEWADASRTYCGHGNPAHACRTCQTEREQASRSSTAPSRCRCHLASSSITVTCPVHGRTGYDFGNPS